MLLENINNALLFKQIVLFSTIVLFVTCEQKELEGEEVEYYNCVSYVDGSNVTHDCIAISLTSPMDWLYETEEECLSGCGNYNCINDNCVSEYGGQYADQDDCLTVCGDDNNPDYGYSCVGYDCVFEENGEYETFLDCWGVCDDYGYNCINGDCVFEENGQYETLQECVNNCNYGYNCVNGDCVFEENGQYETLQGCVNNCNYGYNCVNGDCVFEENGQYETLQECTNGCEDLYEAQVLFYLYDGVPNSIYEESGEIVVYFDIGDENNLNFEEVGSVSTITQSGYIIAPLCVDNVSVVLVDVLTPELGYATYSWRVRDFLNTELYDFGVLTIETDECLTVEVDLQ